jgi:arylsulfatase A-like enzyme
MRAREEPSGLCVLCGCSYPNHHKGRKGHKGRGRALAGLWLAIAILASACSGEHDGPRSALLVTLDTTRADALSCYGNTEPTTPALDALAKEGVAFDAAHTVMAMTLPAHASMLTGLFPLRHGLRDNGVAALPESAQTIATRAHAAGIETAAFLSSVVLDDDFGLDQGFDVYSLPQRRGAGERAHGAERPARETIDAALAWLAARDATRPFFLWIHLYDPHHPYEPGAPFAGRFSTPYLGEVAQADHELGRLLDDLRARGLYEHTFVLALADHGEAFGEHGEIGHGTFCYEATLRIPLIARWPAGTGGRAPGTRSRELVSAADVAPTLVEALGLAPLADVDGASFFSRALPAERGVYFESFYAYLACGWSPLAGWMDERGKYIHSSEPELYDWRADPLESRDVVEERPAESERYRAEIARLAEATALDVQEIGGEEALEGIQKLGYAGTEHTGDLPHPLEPNTLLSPRSQASFFAKQARAQELAGAGRFAEAAAIYEEVLRTTPSNYFAVEELATNYLELDRVAEAIPLLQRLTQEGPQRAKHYLKLGMALVAAKRFEEALEPFQRAVELSGGRPRYLDALRDALTRLGREAEMEAIERRYAKPKARE